MPSIQSSILSQPLTYCTSWLRIRHKAGNLLGLSRCSLSFPVGFDHEDIVEEALPADLAFIPVLAPEPLTEPDGQPTSNCHKFVTWPVPRCGLLQHADDSHRFLKRKIIFTGARCNDFAQLLTKRVDLCELHVFGGPPANPRYEIHGGSHTTATLSHTPFSLNLTKDQ